MIPVEKKNISIKTPKVNLQAPENPNGKSEGRGVSAVKESKKIDETIKEHVQSSRKPVKKKRKTKVLIVLISAAALLLGISIKFSFFAKQKSKEHGSAILPQQQIAVPEINYFAKGIAYYFGTEKVLNF